MSEDASNLLREIVDFDVVRENARKQHVELRQIAILYENSTSEEIQAMRGQNALLDDSESAGRFLPGGSVMFPEKARTVCSLVADV